MAGRSGAITYQVTVDPSPIKIAKILRDLGDNLKSWRGAFEKMPPEFSEGIEENIDSRGRAIAQEGSDPHAAWGPPNRRYLKRKQRMGLGTRELFITGELRRRATDPSRVNVKITAGKLIFGTSLPDLKYARAMQWGKKHGRGGNMPRRYMGFNLAMKAAAIRKMQEHADELLTQAAKALDAKKRGM